MEYQRNVLMPASLTARLNVQPIEADTSLKGRIYDRLKQAITAMNIYAENAELRLDERDLSERLATSRTPIREALARLEQEGLVHIVPRKGVYIVRKSKAEILDMITVWAALEGMAARLAARNASDAEIAGLRQLFTTFKNGQVRARIDEYSDTNVRFHQALLALGKSVPDALKLAPINSMSVVQFIGAQKGLLSLDELEAWFAKAPEGYAPTKL